MTRRTAHYTASTNVSSLLRISWNRFVQTRIYYVQRSKQRSCGMLVPPRCFPGARCLHRSQWSWWLPCHVCMPAPCTQVQLLQQVQLQLAQQWATSGEPQSLGTLPLGQLQSRRHQWWRRQVASPGICKSIVCDCWWCPLHDAQNTCATGWPCQAPQRMASLHGLCPL